ncbi:hypothetical protein WR25_10610 [Diploscapter pachys]|uniref:Uridine 5'-monophosphate synthase n=1 Tax=Diploscapter pachys TaxID=2018661 RepID=A0A2A2JFN3_9BILA|nr:hypothetical protein WR25_10610 [Diploscapter pachys]
MATVPYELVDIGANLSHPQCVAVGECGLDFNRNFSPQDVQRDVFRKQVELACKLQKSLFIHEREAHEDMVKILSEAGDSLPKAVIHCFTGTVDEAKKYVDMGLYIGLTGFLWKDKLPNGVQAGLKSGEIPIERLLLETDAPFMYPKVNDKKLPQTIRDAISEEAKNLHKEEMSNLLVGNSKSVAQTRNLLRNMLKAEVFKFGSFTLKSGQISPIYIDLRCCFGDAQLMMLVSNALVSAVKSTQLVYTGVVGVPYGALPYAAIAAAQGLQKPFVIVRKEAKAHGTKKLIEGNCQSGDTVILIEDVVTTGSSIKEVVKVLRDDGLIVSDVFCILDREQGGKEALLEDGINLHSLLSLETILTFLNSIGKIDDSQWKEIVSALNLKCSEPKKVEFSAEMEDLGKLPISTKKRAPLSVRMENASCRLNELLYKTMQQKESNLCLAIDFTQKEQILELAKVAAPHVVAIKLHADCITDFDDQFVKELRTIAHNHHCIIFEDRKLADIGAVNILQLKGHQNIAKWADVVTVHAVQGQESIEAFRKVINDDNYCLSGILLIAQLSSKGALTQLDGYTQAAREIGEANRDIVAGFICQTKISDFDDMGHWTPGVNLDAKSDDAGQQWRGADEAIRRQLNDIIVVGRGVTASKNPKEQLERYKREAWNAFIGGDNDTANGNGIH